jgi:protein-S-isoprenylcysteine O-methyltransferase Ste14
MRGWAALGVECLFVAVVTGTRLWLRGRWKGTTFIVGRPRLRHLWEWLYWLAVAGFGAGTMLALADLDHGVRLRIGTAWAVAASIVSVIGIGVVWWGQLAMGPAWRIGVDRAVPTELITDGPFRWVRNPIYAGMLVVAAGVTVVLANIGAAIGAAALAAWTEAQVRLVEEPFLLGRHGAAYARWASRTGRFLPGLGRMRAQRAASGRSG